MAQRLQHGRVFLLSIFVSLFWQFYSGADTEPNVPHKWYASDEAVYEIEGWQDYVGALAFHDLHLVDGTTYIEAASDLCNLDPIQFFHGFRESFVTVGSANAGSRGVHACPMGDYW